MVPNLDEASQIEIAVRLRSNPSLSYVEYFAELGRNLTLKGSLFNRNLWRKVVLPTAVDTLTIAKWRKCKGFLDEAISEGEAVSKRDWS